MKKNENNEIPWIKKMGKNDAKTRLKYVSTIYTGNRFKRYKNSLKTTINAETTYFRSLQF